MAELRYDVVQSFERALSGFSMDELDAEMASQRSAAQAALDSQEATAVRYRHTAQMSYTGQIHSLTVTLEAGLSHAEIRARFESAYEAEFGNTLGDIEPIIVTLETAVLAEPPARPGTSTQSAHAGDAVAKAHRRVYFAGWHDTPVYARTDLAPGMDFRGPAIVEQADTTCVIEPGMRARVDDAGNLLVELG